MTATIFKTVDSYTITPFKAYKSWTLTDGTITQYSSSVNEAIYASQSSFVDYGDNSSGIDKRSLFDSINNLYYGWRDGKWNGVSLTRIGSEKLNLSSRAVVVSIGMNYVGERIRPGSIDINDLSSGGSIEILDDYNGNLYDSSITNLVPSGGLVGHWGFDDLFILSSSTLPFNTFTSRNSVDSYPNVTLNSFKIINGVFNSASMFSGNSSSFAIVPNYNAINFNESQDFAVSFWFNLPPSQSVIHSTDTSLIEKWSQVGAYPFAIRCFNQSSGASNGVIFAGTYGGNGAYVGIQTTGSWNNGTWHHCVYQKSGTTSSLYIDAMFASSASLANVSSIQNNSPLWIGGRGANSNQSTTTLCPFSGSIDELRIYSGSLTQQQIISLYNRPSNTNLVGNVFYSQGILVLTNLSGSYSNLLLGSGGTGFTLDYQSTVTIREHEVVTILDSHEFNMTLNPSTVNPSTRGALIESYASQVTSSTWTPYITTVGLYNDSLELLGVAKFAKPIKKFSDIPLAIVVRFDE